MVLGDRKTSAAISGNDRWGGEQRQETQLSSRQGRGSQGGRTAGMGELRPQILGLPGEEPPRRSTARPAYISSGPSALYRSPGTTTAPRPPPMPVTRPYRTAARRPPDSSTSAGITTGTACHSPHRTATRSS